MKAGEEDVTGRGQAGATASPERLGPAGLAGVVALPIVLAGNSLILLLIPWLADFQYALPGFPDDPLGLSAGERLELARDGIRSIWPVGPGSEILIDARLPWGAQAFGTDEVRHMEDVRAVVRGALILWLVAVATLTASLVWLRSRGRTAAVGLVFRRGALATVLALVAVGLFALVAFDTFFRSFHELLFEPGSWQFPADSTLLALYPTRFWTVATGLLVGLTVIQAAIARFTTVGADPE